MRIKFVGRHISSAEYTARTSRNVYLLGNSLAHKYAEATETDAMELVKDFAGVIEGVSPDDVAATSAPLNPTEPPTQQPRSALAGAIAENKKRGRPRKEKQQ